MRQVSWARRLPAVGSLPFLQFSRSDFLLETSRVLGDTYWLDLGIDQVLVIGHPDDAARILENRDGNYFVKGGNAGFRRISLPFLGGGLSTWNAMDAEWQRRRSGFSNLYRNAKFGRVEIDDLADTNDAGLRAMIERTIVADLVTKLVGNQPAAQIIEASDHLRLLAGTFWSAKMPGPHPILGARTRRAITALELMVQGWLNDSTDRSPVRRHLANLSDTQVRDEVLSQLLSVGTLAVPAEWALHLLAANPAVQTALRSSLGQTDDKYLTWTAREVLRLCPSTYWIQRRAERDDELSGATVRAGDVVVIHVPRVHRHPQFWTEPDNFLPERFEEGSNWKRAWMPFGRGPRLCVGHVYSLDLIKDVIARIVSRYVITSKRRSTSALVTGFSLIPRPNPSLTFTPI